MGTEVQTTEPQQLSVSEAMQLSSAQVVEQVQLIQKVLHSVMKQDEHYGVIPGTKKPTLLKAGAEKLCLTFRLSPSYVVERIDHAGSHREYIITAKLTHIPTGKVWGEGVGSCSSLERKYRYRTDYKPTGRRVPKEWWDSKDPALLGGKGFIAKKDDAGSWMIYETTGQIENPDMAEVYNTVLKMAKKRALVDATLNACAASDIFTQDLEETMPQQEPPPPQSHADTLNGKPENKAAQAKWEADTARMKLLPDDIKDFFKWQKAKRDKILSVIDQNHGDHDAIRSYMKGQGWQGSADLSDLAQQRTPEAAGV